MRASSGQRQATAAAETHQKALEAFKAFGLPERRDITRSYSEALWLAHTVTVCQVSEVAGAGSDEETQAGINHKHEQEETDGEVERNSYGPIFLREKLQAGKLKVSVRH